MEGRFWRQRDALMNRPGSDPWTRLAILRRALSAQRLRAQRQAFPRFAARVIQVQSRYRDPELFRRLLTRPTTAWRRILTKMTGEDPGDDPVPQAVVQALAQKGLGLGPLRDALERMPLRQSKNVADRIKNVRRSLRDSLQEIWKKALVGARFRSPLLILDEAHHLKNPATRLASLFVDDEAHGDAHVLSGALAGHFERMLFLTATPFQLGHHELLNVLDRFRGIRWRPGSPTASREEMEAELGRLGTVLDEAHRATSFLDARWPLLGKDDVATLVSLQRREESLDAEDANLGEGESAIPERVRIVQSACAGASLAMRRAEEALHPWVIRHLRSRHFPGTEVLRRKEWVGASILHEVLVDGDTRGLLVSESAVVPFLLAARSHALALRQRRDTGGTSAGRALFAEGLASSYEAFLETRRVVAASDEEGQEAGLLDEDAREGGGSGPSSSAVTSASGALEWYLDRLEQALPGSPAFADHPKIAPTVERVCALWEKGEKVLVFCHFRATGRALVAHLSERLGRHLRDRAAAIFGCTQDEVGEHLEAVGDRFDLGRPIQMALEERVADVLSGYPDLDAGCRGQIHEITRRFVRTPSFLVRHFPLTAEDPNRAFLDSLDSPDASGLTLEKKIRDFVHFLARRCAATERQQYLDALEAIHTGLRRGGGEARDDGDSGATLLPNVRLANGEVKHETRRRLLLTFNTPFFPEILVASSVLAEGVDLHLNCRHVIHHDLCWNPSTLEQRTGRVDRLGSKAERARLPIDVYLPYLEATQDEKMFRVVKDRERWFQVLLGEEGVGDGVALHAQWHGRAVLVARSMARTSGRSGA